MLLIELFLDRAAAARLVDGLAHGIRYLVGVHDDLAGDVSCGTPHGLNERATVPEEALLVRVKDGHERDLWDVKSLSQEVDAHKHIDLALTKISDDVDAVERCRIRVHVVDAKPLVQEVVGEVFCHALGKRGHKDALVAPHALAYLRDKVVNLSVNGTHLNLWVEKPGGTDDLLNLLLRHRLLVVSRRCGDVDELGDARLKLVKAQRPVVERRGQAEAMLDERDLTRAVSLVHATNLRHRNVTLVDDAEHVFGEVIDKRVGRLAGRAPVKVARVVLDAVAVAHVLKHLEVIGGTLREPLGLEQHVVCLELGHALLKLF